MVKGGRIVRLAPSTEFVGFTGKHVDTTGQTVLPGLIDCHIHICIGAEADLVAVLGQLSESELAVRAMENAQSTLRGGVTSARDLGGKSFFGQFHKPNRIYKHKKVICNTFFFTAFSPFSRIYCVLKFDHFLCKIEAKSVKYLFSTMKG